MVIAQQTSMTPAVTINATVRAGGLHEPANRTGLAYLLGRVLDRGTTTRDADVLSEALDDRGVSLRVSSSRHATIVTCTCLSEDFDDVLSIALDIVRECDLPGERGHQAQGGIGIGDPPGRRQPGGSRR